MKEKDQKVYPKGFFQTQCRVELDGKSEFGSDWNKKLILVKKFYLFSQKSKKIRIVCPFGSKFGFLVQFYLIGKVKIFYVRYSRDYKIIKLITVYLLVKIDILWIAICFEVV